MGTPEGKTMLAKAPPAPPLSLKKLVPENMADMDGGTGRSSSESDCRGLGSWGQRHELGLGKVEWEPRL